MHRATKLLIGTGLAGAGAAWYRRRTTTDRWQTDDPLPSLELPVPTPQPMVVPDLTAEPEELAKAANRPHLTVLGDMPLQKDIRDRSGPQDAPRPAETP